MGVTTNATCLSHCVLGVILSPWPNYSRLENCNSIFANSWRNKIVVLRMACQKCNIMCSKNGWNNNNTPISTIIFGHMILHFWAKQFKTSKLQIHKRGGANGDVITNSMFQRIVWSQALQNAWIELPQSGSKRGVTTNTFILATFMELHGCTIDL